MRKSTLIILMFIAGSFTLHAEDPSVDRTEDSYKDLQRLSGAGLNFISTATKDSLVRLCSRAEVQARLAGNNNREFKAGQIRVNAEAASGNISQAVDRAQHLFERACQQDDHLNLGLAMQAMGDTYLFTGHLRQADSVFTEALPYIIRHGDTFMRSEILLQRLHVRLQLQDMSGAKDDIRQLRDLLDSDRNQPEPVAEIHRLLLKSYETLHAIRQGDVDSARMLLADIENENRSDYFTALWRYYVRTHYHTLTKEYDKALAYSDSTLMIARQGFNASLLYDAQMMKAGLLHETQKDEDACSIYQEMVSATDSLYKLQYVSQIDSLHALYSVDQMQVSNILRRNSLFTKFIFGLLTLVLATGAILFVIRRKNRQLVQTRRELEKMRSASDELLRTKSLFLSNMSHELRTPLNAITGFSTILTDEADTDEETRHQCSDYIRQNADLLLKLISDVVDLADLKDDTMRFAYAPCDVVSLCRNVLMTVDNVNRSQVQMHFETSLEELVIVTDKDRLQQVLINLLVNATKFTEQGDITLRLERDAARGEAIFSVEDTGCGVPPEKLNSIFERFEKLHEGIQGAGLGLSICQLIVKHTGGRIWIDPEYKNGARFVFTHPLNLS